MPSKNPRLHISLIALLTLLAVAAHAAPSDSPPLPEGIPTIPQPWTTDPDKFSFVILGDKTSGGEGKWPIFDRAVDSINLLNPDFVITIGDQIPGHMHDRQQWDAEWAEYLEHAHRLQVPALLVVGNHDIANTDCYEFWKQDFGRTYYSFDYKGCHFLILNTEEERFDGRGPIWQAMMTFAEKDLAAHTDARHTFLLFHKPMWVDPRYQDDWARISKALGDRKCTIIAGHEHYLATERGDNRLYIIQNATGGGLTLSDARQYGSFHGFTWVTVDGDSVQHAAIEAGAAIWPIEIAPAALRDAIAFDLFTMDTPAPPAFDQDPVSLHTIARLHNTLDRTTTIRASIPRARAREWLPILEPGSPWQFQDGALTLEKTLEPGQTFEAPLAFSIPRRALCYPPRYATSCLYEGQWLPGNAYGMIKTDVVPLYPASCIKMVPEWQLVGPFIVGKTDKSHLPDDLEKANPNLLKRFGPEDGYDPGRTYESGRTWFKGRTQGKGLLNCNGLFGSVDYALGYALCGIYSPVDQLTHVTVQVDNFSQVVLNGELLDEGQNFGGTDGYAYTPLHLRAGWNTVLVKIFNYEGDWFARIFIADPMGNLEFADHPQ